MDMIPVEPVPQETTFYELPIEVLLKIFGKLNLWHLVTASKVHRDWHFIIDSHIGFDFQIGPLDAKKTMTADRRMIQASLAEMTVSGIRNCILGETYTQPELTYNMCLKHPLLLKTVMLAGATFPSHLEALLVNDAPLRLSTMEILFPSLVVPMTAVFERFKMPNLKLLIIKDIGVPKSKIKKLRRKSKREVMRIITENIIALLGVTFPQLKTFKFHLSKSAWYFTEPQQTRLLLTCFSFLQVNRVSVKEFEFHMKKRHSQAEEDLSNALAGFSVGVSLESFDFSVHTNMQLTTRNGVMAFLRGQTSLRKFALSTDSASTLAIIPVVTQRNHQQINEISSTICYTRIDLINNLDIHTEYNCDWFRNCANLRTLSLQVWNKHKRRRARRWIARTLGFSPGLVHPERLPQGLVNLNLVSLALLKADLLYIVTNLPNLRTANLFGSRLGQLYGITTIIVKRVIRRRQFDSISMGYIIRGKLPRKGIPNGDPNPATRIMIRSPRQVTVVHLVKNEHGFYKLASTSTKTN